MKQSVFRAAIDDGAGSVDAGYLALYWTMFATVGAIPFLLIVSGLAVYHSPEKAAEVIQATGIAIGAICTGAGVVIGAVGAFRMGDKPRAQTAELTTTTTRTETVTPGQQEPLQVDVVGLPNAKQATKTPARRR